jgi:hypothetical protein
VELDVRPSAEAWRAAAGLIGGPAAWAVATQAAYAAAPLVCGGMNAYVLVLPLVAALVAAGAGYVSFAAGRGGTMPRHGGAPRSFLAFVGTGVGALVALVLVVQGTSAFFLTGCVR